MDLYKLGNYGVYIDRKDVSVVTQGIRWKTSKNGIPTVELTIDRYVGGLVDIDVGNFVAITFNDILLGTGILEEPVSTSKKSMQFTVRLLGNNGVLLTRSTVAKSDYIDEDQDIVIKKLLTTNDSGISNWILEAGTVDSNGTTTTRVENTDRLTPILSICKKMNLWSQITHPAPAVSTVDSNAVARTDDLTLDNTTTGIAQSFTCTTETTLDSCKFILSKTLIPTGNAYAKLYAHSGTYGTDSIPTGDALATSDAFDVSSLDGTPTLTTFSFTSGDRRRLDTTTYYCITIEYEDGDAANYVNVGIDDVTLSASGNSASYTTLWTADAAIDVCFYVYGSDDYHEIDRFNAYDWDDATAYPAKNTPVETFNGGNTTRISRKYDFSRCINHVRLLGAGDGRNQLESICYHATDNRSTLKYALDTWLTADLTAIATTLNVTSTDGFETTGAVEIDQERITYTGKTGTTFTGCTRATSSTVAAAHTSNAQVINIAPTYIYVESNTDFPVVTGTPIILDSYSESNQDDGRKLYSGAYSDHGQTWTNSNAMTLTSAKFYLKIFDSPTGNATANVYAHTGVYGYDGKPTGAALATSDTIDVSTIDTDYELTEFTFSGGDQIVLEADTYYVVVVTYTGGDSSNYLVSGYDWDGSADGNTVAKFTGTWGSNDAKDTCFYVYGEALAQPVWIGLEKITYTTKTDTDKLSGTITRGVDWAGTYEPAVKLYYAHGEGAPVMDAQYTTADPEAGSSIATYGFVGTIETDTTIIDQNALDVAGGNIITDFNIPPEIVTIDTTPSFLNTVWLGDTVTVADEYYSGVDDDYRIYEMEFTDGIGKQGKLKLTCGNDKYTFSKDQVQTKRELGNLSVYAQGVPQTISINKYDDCDGTGGTKYDLEMPFYIPDEAISIDKAALSFNLSKYRISYTPTTEVNSENSDIVDDACVASSIVMDEDDDPPTDLETSTGEITSHGDGIFIRTSGVVMMSLQSSIDTAWLQGFNIRVKRTGGSTVYYPSSDGVCVSMGIAHHSHEVGATYGYDGSEFTDIEESYDWNGDIEVEYPAYQIVPWFFDILIPEDPYGYTYDIEASISDTGTAFTNEDYAINNMSYEVHSRHTHTIDYGITKGPTVWDTTDTKIFIDDGNGYVDRTAAIETVLGRDLAYLENGKERDIDISPYLGDSPGWKGIKIEIDGRGRIDGTLYLKYFETNRQ